MVSTSTRISARLTRVQGRVSPNNTEYRLPRPPCRALHTRIGVSASTRPSGSHASTQQPPRKAKSTEGGRCDELTRRTCIRAPPLVPARLPRGVRTQVMWCCACMRSCAASVWHWERQVGITCSPHPDGAPYRGQLAPRLVFCVCVYVCVRACICVRACMCVRACLHVLVWVCARVR